MNDGHTLESCLDRLSSQWNPYERNVYGFLGFRSVDVPNVIIYKALQNVN